MLTKNEITALSLSPTKKDFVQIWNELLEVAGKLSERWDPTSTNESDPGIVILKALTGIADKLNYNIDKNILEAFMPTAAQEDSMRKLCDMLGYNIKYYRSAETSVTIKYHNTDPSEDESVALRDGLLIPKFTVITNSDRDINYFTTNQTPYYISATTPSVTLNCMEGQLVKCESTADNNVITIAQISENNRFYLPEAQVAENGIFIYNVFSEGTSLQDGTGWEKVDNLNIQARGSRVFKFGYDSYESRPYIEFPEDYSELINDGLFIYYARTSGANGNVSPRTLTQLEIPSSWKNVSAESFTVENIFAATTGANIETIKQAYTNFKKTVGTFETLVTCRDYMNKIYTMTTDTGKPLVSNILVTDIRNDLNRAITICSCDDAGIFYKEMPLIVGTNVSKEISEPELETQTEVTTVASVANKPFYSDIANIGKFPNSITRITRWFIGSTDEDRRIPLFYDEYDRSFISAPSGFNAGQPGEVSAYTADGEPSDYWLITQNDVTYTTQLPIEWSTFSETNKVNKITVVNTIEEEPAIDHFDLVLYPFKSYNQIKGNVKDIQEVYDSSFRYSSKSFNDVKNALEESSVKTIAHNIIGPRSHDIVCINNYLRLNAIIGTNSKITSEESTLLIETIKIALANAFNMRELDFGEEIPFESIVDVIEKADSRIKVVSLNEPALYTTFSVYEGTDSYGNPVLKEYAVASEWLSEAEADASGRFDNNTFNTAEAKKIYNKLAVRNILAGRVPLFKYNNTFKTSFAEGAYRITETVTDNIPEQLPTPSKDNPFTIWTDGINIYTGQLSEGATEPVYKKTSVPEKYVNNIITKDPTDDSNENNLTEITTSCEVMADDSDGTKKISDVVLAAGEFIKFRAPNFITTKTYPAYVNYHLALNQEILAEAAFADADNLFALLNGDGTVQTQKWDAVMDYFKGTAHKKKFTLTQKVSKVSSETGTMSKPKLEIENLSAGTPEGSPEEILKKSGCVQLCNKGTPILKWADGSTEGSPNIELKDLTISMSNGAWFIVNANTFRNIQSTVDSFLEDLPIEQLPNQDWTISYEFEYVPFENSTLTEWEKFIKSEGLALFGYKPVEENNTVLWRAHGEGYQEGKYVRPNGSKLVSFTSSYFGILDSLDTRLHGIYIAKDLGRDRKPGFISNNEEYMLRDREYLCIEYTPSTTTEEGAAQTQETVKEVHGPGTIIRPSGFEEGFTDSTAYSLEHSPIKTVTFELPTGGTGAVGLYSLGANEQVEIREFSRVVLDKASFTDTTNSRTNTAKVESTTIFIYKNFNGCKALEGPAQYDKDGKRINNSYTLKDGEYIFYTDRNKAELAYFTSGTEVTLTGKTTIPEFDLIDLATIFDSGLQEIPWQALSFANNDGITFQEYQYVTLGPNDTLKALTIKDTQDRLSEQWQYCDDINYLPAGAEEPSTLPKINTFNSDAIGSGWEASSLLELNVSPSATQTLRTTDKIKTSLTLNKTSTSRNEREPVILEAVDSQHPLSFKANMVCQSSDSQAKIDELYTNTNNIKSFEFKVFSEEMPAVVKTELGKLVPYRGTGTVDITNWLDSKALTTKAYGELWNQVPLKELQTDETSNFEKALKLATSILPNTYGIFSIYLDYGEIKPEVKTWIELFPGMSRKNVTLINVEENEIDWEISSEDGTAPDRLLLKPGLNCVRINGTCDLFIKTTKASTGTLYFDELRLVDTMPISYLDDGQTRSYTTQGLNLTQLGYLDTSETSTFNVFDMRVRKKLKSDYTDKALDLLATKEQKVLTSLSAAWKILLESKPKVQTLISFIETSITEIENLYQADANDKIYKDEEIIQGLLNNYADIYEGLKQELALKTALENNKSIDELEQQLVSLLKSFTSLEATQQELIDNLEALREAANKNAESFSTLIKEDVVDDFKVSANPTTDTTLLAELKLASLEKINAQYNKQLDSIAENIDGVANSEDYARLTAALEKLHTKKHTELLNQVQSLVTDNQEDLISAVDTALTAATGTLNKETTLYEVDYTQVAEQLRLVREQVNSFDLNALVSKIEFAANESLYDDLPELITSLKALLNTEDTNLINKIDSLLTTVQAKVSSNSITQDEDILGDIKEIQSDIYSTRNNQIEELLEALEDTLEAIENNYSNIISNLKSSQDEQITELSSQLERIAQTRSDDAGLVNAFGKNPDFDLKQDYINLPFGEEAVLAIWPGYMKQHLIKGIDQLYTRIRNVIKNPSGVTVTDSLEIPDNFNTVGSSPVLRTVLAKAANISAFQKLFEDAKDLAHEHTQNSKRSQVVDQLGKIVPFSNELNSALTSIKNDNNSDRNASLCNIINKLQTEERPSVTEKQQLLKTLALELDKVIQLDTQLVEISAKFLCPSILLFKEAEAWSTVQEDEFYSELRTFVATQKDNLLKNETPNTILGSILSALSGAHQKVLALSNVLDSNKMKDFKLWVEDLTTESLQGALLSKNYENSLFNIKELFESQNQIVDIKKCNLFRYLADNLVVAWEDTEGNWMDSAGNYFKQYANNDWVDADNYWLTQNGKKVKVNVQHTKENQWIDCDTKEEIAIKDDKAWLSGINKITLRDTGLDSALNELLTTVTKLGQTAIVSDAFKEAYNTLKLEEQLLADIRAIDRNRNFYYNVSIEPNVAIDFNENDVKLNTLMNPAINYDINNVNNSFVVSKLDINYLTNGIQVARSSRLS